MLFRGHLIFLVSNRLSYFPLYANSNSVYMRAHIKETRSTISDLWTNSLVQLTMNQKLDLINSSSHLHHDIAQKLCNG